MTRQLRVKLRRVHARLKGVLVKGSIQAIINSGVNLAAVLLSLKQLHLFFVKRCFAEMGVPGAQAGLPAARRGGTAAASGLGHVLEKAGNAGRCFVAAYFRAGWFGRESGPTLSPSMVNRGALPSSWQ